ncbi:putative integral membrane protein [Brugia pahangi]
MSQYEPWYLRRRCPIFFYPCVPVYVGVWPARKCVVILSAILFAIGVMILLGLLLTCIAVECSAIAGALLPLALLLIMYLVTNEEKSPNPDEIALFESAYKEPIPEIRQGYWQFEDKLAWQTVANPYPIQHTLRNTVERPEY